MSAVLKLDHTCQNPSGYADVYSYRILLTTLDALAAGVVVVTADTTIVHANAAALRMLNAGESIARCRGQLKAWCPRASATLTAATRTVALFQGQNSNVPLHCRDGSVAVAHLRPLDNALYNRPNFDAMTVAIFITEETLRPKPPLEALSKLYDLTMAETRVLEQIFSGKTRREAAAALGVAHSTVKTHLQNLFAKTRTCDQLGLCRLVSALSWPCAQHVYLNKIG